MNRLVPILMIVFFSCVAHKKATEITTVPTGTDSTALPVCIIKMIGDFKRQDVENPPRRIYSYTWNGQTVYYVSAPCCDMYSNLYDSACNLIAHPDGGFTGRGDNKVPDFKSEAKNEKLVWKDSRQ